MGNHKYVAVINRVHQASSPGLMSAFGMVLIAIFIIHRIDSYQFLAGGRPGIF